MFDYVTNALLVGEHDEALVDASVFAGPQGLVRARREHGTWYLVEDSAETGRIVYVDDVQS